MMPIAFSGTPVPGYPVARLRSRPLRASP